MKLRVAYHFGAYYLSLIFFASCGIALNLFGLLFGWVVPAAGREKFFQRLVQKLFALFLWWMAVARLFHVRFTGFERLPPGGCVVAANHPGLMDITFLLARIPGAVCIFKPAIRRNPVLGAAARRAGYLCSDGGHDLVRAAGEKVAAGARLVIFPEGTRSAADGALGAFRPGFVLIARRAAAPIQLVRLACDSNALVKGRAWWKVPRFPGRVDVTFGPCVSVPADGDAGEISARIAAWFRDGTPPDAPLA